MREIARAEKATAARNFRYGFGSKPQPFAEGNMRDRRAILLLHEKRDHARREQSGHERPGKEHAVVVLRRFENEERGQRPDDRADRIHRALQSESAAVSGTRHRRGEQRLPHRRAHPASQPRARACEEHMPRVCRQTERRRAERSRKITGNRNRLATPQTVGVIARRHLRETGEAIGNALDNPEPRRRHPERGEKRGHRRGRDLVRPIAEERRQSDTENGAVEPRESLHPTTGCINRWARDTANLTKALIRRRCRWRLAAHHEYQQLQKRPLCSHARARS